MPYLLGLKNRSGNWKYKSYSSVGDCYRAAIALGYIDFVIVKDQSK